ncbi:hypothetical protein BHV55_06755 [Bacillus sp. RZ2MS9]|uniref:hypothetical protein n=1 Tax=Bacillus sp. RZ2MS9 TaxID=1806216 RepID=UPI0008A1D5F8|nr:hypothetical protein [Bacillus sp. RZ2MS9]QIZ41387.1 hypothetical protein BHV55_06755 [Bacillus sp. RZ2MS9]
MTNYVEDIVSENKFWNIKEVKVSPNETSTYENMEYITVSTDMKYNEQLREKFPYELPQSTHDMLCGRITLYKTPKTNEDWHQHYMKKAEIASDVAEEYHAKAHYYKKQAKQVLKG